MTEKEIIFKQGSKYANENWNVNSKPNEHDNAREDFIAGALWAVKNLGLFSVSNSVNCKTCKYLGKEHDRYCDNCNSENILYEAINDC